MKLQERLQELQGRWVKHPSEYPFAAEQTLASIKKDIERVLWGMSLISIEDGRSEHYATGYNKALDDVRKALEEYIK